MNSFYTDSELKEIGFKEFGKKVKISRKTSIYNPEKMIIGDNVRIDDFCILSGEITLGSHIHIAAYCGLWGAKGIVLEDFCGLSSKVTIYSISDDYSGLALTNPTISDEYKKVHGGLVTLSKHVIIGAVTVILPALKISLGCAIGSFSLVNKSTKPWGIYAGVPAKRIKERNKVLLKYEKEFLSNFLN